MVGVGSDPSGVSCEVETGLTSGHSVVASYDDLLEAVCSTDESIVDVEAHTV